MEGVKALIRPCFRPENDKSPEVVVLEEGKSKGGSFGKGLKRTTL